jgi:hypothetical protein
LQSVVDLQRAARSHDGLHHGQPFAAKLLLDKEPVFATQHRVANRALDIVCGQLDASIIQQ